RQRHRTLTLTGARLANRTDGPTDARGPAGARRRTPGHAVLGAEHGAYPHHQLQEVHHPGHAVLEWVPDRREADAPAAVLVHRRPLHVPTDRSQRLSPAAELW